MSELFAQWVGVIGAMWMIETAILLGLAPILLISWYWYGHHKTIKPHRKLRESDAIFLRWVADRFVHTYRESQNVDFVLKLKEIATRLEGKPQSNRARTCDD